METFAHTATRGKSTKTSSLPTWVSMNGDIISNEQSIIEEFNKFFSKLGKLSHEFSTQA